MSHILQPWQLLLVFLASWINRQQAEVIDYLRTENQVLKENLGPRRILLSNDQRRRLAVKGKVLGRRRLEEIGTLFTPETLLRWHRTLVAQKWDHSAKRGQTGRPLVDAEIVELIVKLARENPAWGYLSLAGRTANPHEAWMKQTATELTHYHSERNHQGHDNQVLQPEPDLANATGPIECRGRPGGLLRYYPRRAA